MHNACVERHLVPAGHQERPERTASARRVAQNVVRRRPAAVGGAWAAGASVSGGDVTAAILRAHSARYYASLEAATARATSPDARVELTPAGDTMGCGESLLAARAAVAISIEAVRAARRVPCAACLVRPPGHHVARGGSAASCGPSRSCRCSEVGESPCIREVRFSEESEPRPLRSKLGLPPSGEPRGPSAIGRLGASAPGGPTRACALWLARLRAGGAKK